MKAYLELEGKLGPKPQPQSQLCISIPSHNNSLTRKTLVPKKAEKKRTARAPVKRRYKVRVIAQPLPSTPTSTSSMDPIPPAAHTPTVATSTVTTQMPMVKSVATSIPVTVYNLAQGKFEGIPYPTRRPPVEDNSLPPAVVHPNKGNNLKLYPMPKPSRSEKTPHGLTPYQPPQICLKPGQIGQFPLCKHPQLR